MFWKKDTVSFYCVIITLRSNIHNDSCRVNLGLLDAAMIFPISLIVFEKMRMKVSHILEKKNISFYCVIIGLWTNIHNDSWRVWLGLSDAAMTF